MATYEPTFNELGSSRPKFTSITHRDVYNAIDPCRPELSLKGKTILVAGATRGIGVGIVESFAKAQAKIIILTGRSESTVSALPNKMEFEKKYPTTQFIGLPLDVALEESVNKLFSSLKDIVDKIVNAMPTDILVSNAGVISEYGPKLGDTNLEKFMDDMLINGHGPYLLARSLINFNAPQYPSTFIAIVTTVNEDFTNNDGYMLGKTVPVKMVSLLDAEYPNIRAFSVFPGIVLTDATLDSFRPMSKDTRTYLTWTEDAQLKHYCLAALAGGLCVYLSHPHADFLSGRFLSAHWDVDQIQERKDEIIKENLLKLAISGW